MSPSDRHKNMSEDESSDLQYNGVYSDTESLLDVDHDVSDSDGYESDTNGDRYSDEVYQVKVDKLAAEIQADEDEMKKRYNRLTIQNPDEMEFILPTRQLPSIQEMNEEWDKLINLSFVNQKRLWAVTIIQKWWKPQFDRIMLKSKLAIEQARERDRRKQYFIWKKIRSPLYISQLRPIASFESDYLKMIEMKRNNSLIQSEMDEKKRMVALEVQRKFNALKLAKMAKKAFASRNLLKKGMNKNTVWHKDRASGALAVKIVTVSPVSEAGNGKRSLRKIRQEKDRKVAIEEATRIATKISQISQISQINQTVVITDIALDEEQTKIDEEEKADAEEEEKELVRLKLLCI